MRDIIIVILLLIVAFLSIRLISARHKLLMYEEVLIPRLVDENMRGEK